jgi:hypothetical protein
MITSFLVSTPEAFSTLLAENPKANLALTFSSLKFDTEGIKRVAVEADLRICGCSTAGEIYDGSLEVDQMTGLLLSVPPTSFKVWQGIAGDPYENAVLLGREAIATYTNPQIFLLSGGIHINGEEIISSICKGAKRSLTIVGGIAADDFAFQGTFSYSETDTLNPGITAVIFDGDQVQLKNETTSGWEPIGNEYVITKAEGNQVQMINNEPALGFFNKHFGRIYNSEVKGSEVSLATSQYPLQLLRPEGNILRAPMMEGDNDTIFLAAGVKSGERFRFSIAPGVEVIDQTVEYFEERNKASQKPDGVLMISCKGRHAAFGPLLEDEIQQIYDIFDAPMAGFLSYGEFGSIENKECALHNNTCSMVLINIL